MSQPGLFDFEEGLLCPRLDIPWRNYRKRWTSKIFRKLLNKVLKYSDRKKGD